MKFSALAVKALSALLARSDLADPAAADSFDLAILPTVRRPYPTLQPVRPTPAQNLYVTDVSRLDHDQQLPLASLLGLVNRTKQQISHNTER